MMKLRYYLCIKRLLVSEVGWRMQVHPKSHPVTQLEFDVIIGADGRRNTLPGTLLQQLMYL